jgi:hypothetical protein
MSMSLATADEREHARARARQIEQSESKHFTRALLAGLGLGGLVFVVFRINPLPLAGYIHFVAAGLVGVGAILKAVGRRIVTNAVSPEVRPVVEECNLERVVAWSLPAPTARYVFDASHAIALSFFFTLGVMLMTLVGLFVGS